MASEASTFTTVLENNFKERVPHIDLSITTELRRLYPTKQVLPIPILSFDDYVAEIQKVPVEEVRLRWKGGLSWAQWTSPSYGVAEGELYTRVESGHQQFTWEGTVFEVYCAHWQNSSGCPEQYYALVFDGDTDAAGRELYRAISVWDDKRRMDSSIGIWVFDQGNWTRDKELSTAIESVTWDDLVLEPNMADRLRRDVSTFFKSEPVYKSLGVTWKRGLLLLGPPGNGKSHTLKILVKETTGPCLYVKSTASLYGAEHCIKLIFEKARQTAPCMLVLEDLDSLLKDDTRGFFLNEVDGFANNSGVLIVASSNHPERIDDAIINRPSRFDVKYNFGLPKHELRRKYAIKWLLKIGQLDSSFRPDLNVSDPEPLAERIAQGTEGFSYAFLKELFLSFLLSYAHAVAACSGPNAEEVLFQQVEQLNEQVKKEKKPEEAEPVVANGPVVVTN